MFFVCFVFKLFSFHPSGRKEGRKEGRKKERKGRREGGRERDRAGGLKLHFSSARLDEQEPGPLSSTLSAH